MNNQIDGVGTDKPNRGMSGDSTKQYEMCEQGNVSDSHKRFYIEVAESTHQHDSNALTEGDINK